MEQLQAVGWGVLSASAFPVGCVIGLVPKQFRPFSFLIIKLSIYFCYMGDYKKRKIIILIFFSGRGFASYL
jgi:hypothetical protein